MLFNQNSGLYVGRDVRQLAFDAATSWMTAWCVRIFILQGNFAHHSTSTESARSARFRYLLQVSDNIMDTFKEEFFSNLSLKPRLHWENHTFYLADHCKARSIQTRQKQNKTNSVCSRNELWFCQNERWIHRVRCDSILYMLFIFLLRSWLFSMKPAPVLDQQLWLARHRPGSM